MTKGRSKDKEEIREGLNISFKVLQHILVRLVSYIYVNGLVIVLSILKYYAIEVAKKNPTEGKGIKKLTARQSMKLLSTYIARCIAND